jgi:hypothetical protein
VRLEQLGKFFDLMDIDRRRRERQQLAGSCYHFVERQERAVRQRSAISS